MYPAVILAALTFTLASEERIASVADCTFIANRDEVLTRETRIRRETGERAEKVSRAFSLRSAAPAPGGAAMPRRNYIDEEIFGKMARLSVTPARLTDDQEFFRRINLDLIGRLPSPGEIRDFLAGASPAKRDEAIDRLLYSPEFVDKWTLWLGDLLQNTSSSVNVARQIGGRDAFYNWIKQAVLNNKSFKDLAYETIIACGNTYDPANGATNFVLGSSAPMGPIQDTYDMMLVKSATTFLGLGYYDCLLCHNGRRHLDLISLWGGQATRAEAWQMAAFFARQRFHRSAAAEGEPLYRSTDVGNAATGAYDLNTNYGNRPARAPIGNIRSLTPQYRLGGTPARGQEWRDAFAANIAADPMFSRNIVNRLWKEFFNLGLVDPVDTLDPARMDPANPPPAPWTLQPTHPELLNRMAQDFVAGNFNLREFIRTLVQSNAYQLSSRYDGEWKYEYTVLFARHYPRRLMGEEIGGGGAVGHSTSRAARGQCLHEQLLPRQPGHAAAQPEWFHPAATGADER
jgi:hypothetical protein